MCCSVIRARMKLACWRRYGTTDIILGGVDGTSSITSNDFNRRGEYEGGPDGCAIDFETSSSGVRVDGRLRWPTSVCLLAWTAHAVIVPAEPDACIGVPFHA